jgi:hypothetical protein
MYYPLLSRLMKMALVLACILLSTLPALAARGDDLISQRPPGEGPTRIDISFYLIDLMKVIDVDETFEADVFFVARWQDSRLAGSGVRVVPTSEVWTPNILVFNKRDVSIDLPQVVTIEPDGSVVYRQRLIGEFASPLDLHRFPLDSQTLHIQLVSYGTNTEEVVLAESPGFAATRNPDLSIGDWTVGSVRMEGGEFHAIPGAPALSRFTVRLDVKRLVGYYVVQLLIPLILIVAMSWMSFWINPEIIPTRVGTCVTTVLTLIAFRFMVGGLVPRLPYLTLVDYLLLGATVLVAASLLVVAIGSMLAKERPHIARRIDRVARVVHPLSFLLLILGIYLFG